MFEYCQVYFNEVRKCVIAEDGVDVIATGENVISVLNQLGKNGWELVCATEKDGYVPPMWYLKRNPNSGKIVKAGISR